MKFREIVLLLFDCHQLLVFRHATNSHRSPDAQTRCTEIEHLCRHQQFVFVAASVQLMELKQKKKNKKTWNSHQNISRQFLTCNSQRYLDCLFAGRIVHPTHILAAIF